ncbi:N-succinylarginine dihydrolase [Aureliella helgolandensis]|uniref:N-succinylarginine dihydrolase n=2 Tax=Aureliella helgolandensis TaxID=2527968 RepID=A0A518GHL6_9BACT|nr:N-succinylarginine dihydrolase [Aureliella helgolandensis]
MVLICPEQCRMSGQASQLIERLLNDPAIPLEEVCYVSLAESMSGGGGPACLRLRLPVEVDQLSQLNPGCRVDRALENALTEAIELWYPRSPRTPGLGQSRVCAGCAPSSESLARATRPAPLYALKMLLKQPWRVSIVELFAGHVARASVGSLGS